MDTKEIMAQIKKHREVIEAKEKEIIAIKAQIEALNEQLPALWVFTSTPRNEAYYGTIICAGTKDFCIEYMQKEYPHGWMVSEHQFNDTNKWSMVLGNLERITVYHHARLWKDAQKWVQNYENQKEG